MNRVYFEGSATGIAQQLLLDAAAAEAASNRDAVALLRATLRRAIRWSCGVLPDTQVAYLKDALKQTSPAELRRVEP